MEAAKAYTKCWRNSPPEGFHIQQQPLCHLPSTGMKAKPLDENSVLHHTKTKKQKYPLISK